MLFLLVAMIIIFGAAFVYLSMIPELNKRKSGNNYTKLSEFRKNILFLKETDLVIENIKINPEYNVEILSSCDRVEFFKNYKSEKLDFYKSLDEKKQKIYFILNYLQKFGGVYLNSRVCLIQPLRSFLEYENLLMVEDKILICYSKDNSRLFNQMIDTFEYNNKIFNSFSEEYTTYIDKVDQTKVNQTKSDRTKSDQTKSDQNKSDQNKSNQTKADQTKVNQTKVNQTKVNQTKVNLDTFNTFVKFREQLIFYYNPKKNIQDSIKIFPRIDKYNKVLKMEYTQKIPKIIMVFGKNLDNLHRIRILNPEYVIYHFDYNKAKKFIIENINVYAQKYDSSTNKKEFFKFCWLYLKGGFCIETDIYPKLPLREIVSPEDENIIIENYESKFISCLPLDSKIKHYLEYEFLKLDNPKTLKLDENFIIKS